MRAMSVEYEWVAEIEYKGRRYHVIGGGVPVLDVSDIDIKDVSEAQPVDVQTKREVLKKFWDEVGEI